MDLNVKPLANAVMRGVAVSGVVVPGNLDRAVAVMRAELAAFFLEERYASHRECVLGRSLSDATVVAAIVAECVSQLGRGA